MMVFFYFMKNSLLIVSYFVEVVTLILEGLWEGEIGPLCSFLSFFFFRERVKPWFLVTFIFNNIIRDIFPENFIEIYHDAQKIWRFFSSTLAIFANIFDFLLVVNCRKTNDVSIYLRWCKQFFSFNLF